MQGYRHSHLCSSQCVVGAGLPFAGGPESAAMLDGSTTPREAPSPYPRVRAPPPQALRIYNVPT